MYFILFLIPSILVTTGAFLWDQYKQYRNATTTTTTRRFGHVNKVTIKELVISMGVNIVVALLAVVAIMAYVSSKVHDTYVVTGAVTEKERVHVPCEHSYQCRCRTVCSGSGDNKSCSTVCDTCYEHTNDWNWVVRSSVGDTNIDRVDRQGRNEPSRFSQVVIGEPFTTYRRYANYLKADKSSLFVESAEPANFKYPSITDYYKLNHTVNAPDDIAQAVREWAKDKRINPLVVVNDNTSSSYFDSVMKAFDGGNMNDVILVYGVAADNTVQWFNAGTYARGYKNSALISELGNYTLLNPPLTAELVISQLDYAVAHFVTLPADEFKESINLLTIPTSLIILLLMVNVLISIGIHVYMVKNDV